MFFSAYSRRFLFKKITLRIEHKQQNLLTEGSILLKLPHKTPNNMGTPLLKKLAVHNQDVVCRELKKHGTLGQKNKPIMESDRNAQLYISNQFRDVSFSSI